MEPTHPPLEQVRPRRSASEWALLIAVLIVVLGLIALAVAWWNVRVVPRQPASPRRLAARPPPAPLTRPPGALAMLPPAAAPVVLPQDPWQVQLTLGQSVALPGGVGTPTVQLDRLDDRTAYITVLPSMPTSTGISGQGELAVTNGTQGIYFDLIYVRTGQATFNVSLAPRFPWRQPATQPTTAPS